MKPTIPISFVLAQRNFEREEPRHTQDALGSSLVIYRGPVYGRSKKMPSLDQYDGNSDNR